MTPVSSLKMLGRLSVAVCLAVLLSAGPHIRARQNAGSSSNSQSHPPSQPPSSQSMGDMPGMAGMDHGQMSANQMANEQMMQGHHHMGPHMHMTAVRPASADDWTRADEVAATLKDSIEKYKDYHVALADGFEPFLPNLPQPMYHFTSARNGFLEAFTFDPARPTSLLYKKTATGYELIGAMYTMPRRATEAQLNERIPLGVAQWHLHTNLCMPARGQKFDQTRFGLNGSIVTQDACEAAGGKFYPAIFGWMVHVYPFESSREKIWEQ